MNKKSRIQMVMRERYLVSEYKDCHSLMTVVTGSFKPSGLFPPALQK